MDDYEKKRNFSLKLVRLNAGLIAIWSIILLLTTGPYWNLLLIRLLGGLGGILVIGLVVGLGGSARNRAVGNLVAGISLLVLAIALLALIRWVNDPSGITGIYGFMSFIYIFIGIRNIALSRRL